MMKIFNKILWGIKPPENKSDIWFDGDVFKIYRKGDWEAITIEIDAASKLADVIKNINDVYQTKLTEGDGILLEDSKISVRRIFQVVNRLPKIGEYNTIYLLVEDNKEIGSYIYVNNEWMSLVSTIEIDKNLNIYSTNPVENKAVTKKIESLDVVRIVEGGVSGLESGNFRDGSVGSAISSDHALAGVTLTREHVGCTIQGVKWIHKGGLILFPNFGVNTSCTINLRNNYGDIGSIKMYYKDNTSIDIDIILPNEHITLMKNSNVFLPENVNTVLTNKLAYYQIVGIYNNGFDVDSFAPYFQFDLTRDIRTLYFKNGDWKKVLIEDNVKTINGHSILGDGNIVIEGGEGGSDIHEIKYDYVNGNPLSGEDIAFNKEVFDKLNKNELSALYVTISIDNHPIYIIADSFVYTPPSNEAPLSCVYLTFSSDALTIFGLQKKIVAILSNGQCTGMPISSNIVDDEMSDTSENAVQNKVITEELNNKVDKVSGKQLSTEDFTTELKTRLEGMSSFDPTEINNKVNGLQTQIDTLVSGDTSTAIESFNEIANFLNGIEDTKSLEGIIAGIERQITNKQDTIADLDTIRSGAALGATALQEIPDGYATEAWVSTEIAKAQLEGGDVDFSGYATKDDIKDFASEQFVTDEIAKIEIPTLDNYATEAWVGEQGFLTEHQDITGKQDVIEDLEAIRDGASKGATALQSYTEQYKGTVTGIKVNGSTHNPSNGVVDLGTISADESLRIHFEPNFDLGIGQPIDVTSLVQQSMGITPAELYEEVATNEKKTYLFIHETMGGELQEISRVIDPTYGTVGLSYLSTLEGLPSPFQLIISQTQCQLVIVDTLAGYNSVVAPLTEMVEGKQEQLVSGTNIKTINGESILGGGDIEVSYDDPKLKVVNHASSDTNVELTPYVTHKWGTISSLTLTFSESTESEYNVVFEASDADFILSIPQNIRWANSQIPQFEAKKQYEINIKGERALYAVFDAPYVEET